MENNKTQTPDTETTEKKTSLKVEPIAFDGQAKCLYTSTIELADKIGAMLAPAFKDYSGCKISINNGLGPNVILNTIAPGALYVDLYFKEGAGNTNQGIQNLVRRVDIKSSELSSRLEHVLGGMASRVYEVSKSTKDILEEFVPLNRNPRWNERILEHSVQTSYMTRQNDIVVRIIGLSLDLIVAKIYGKSVVDEDGNKDEYDYSIVPIRQVFNTRDEYVLQITQLNKQIVQDLSKSLGMNFQTPADYNEYRR